LHSEAATILSKVVIEIEQILLTKAGQIVRIVGIKRRVEGSKLWSLIEYLTVYVEVVLGKNCVLFGLNVSKQNIAAKTNR